MKTSRIKERLGNVRRLFKENWILFKESRIGLFGLGVILFFLFVALLAPILDINDPIQFRAPEEDVIGIDKYWVNDIKDRYGPLEGNSSIAMRMQGLSFNPKVDRIYVAASTRLLAIHEFSTGQPGSFAWGTPLTTIGEITTPVLAVNYGENQLIAPEDYWIYVGTSDGYLYLVNDTTDGNQYVSESHMQLGSAISSIVVYNNELNGYRTAVDKVFVGTEDGTLHAFWAANHTETWNITLDGEVHMTPGPMRGTGGYPIYSPALNQDGSILVAGTANEIVPNRRYQRGRPRGRVLRHRRGLAIRSLCAQRDRDSAMECP
jgi:outer membrane protein assembly factor BamB